MTAAAAAVMKCPTVVGDATDACRRIIRVRPAQPTIGSSGHATTLSRLAAWDQLAVERRRRGQPRRLRLTRGSPQRKDAACTRQRARRPRRMCRSAPNDMPSHRHKVPPRMPSRTGCACKNRRDSIGVHSIQYIPSTAAELPRHRPGQRPPCVVAAVLRCCRCRRPRNTVSALLSWLSFPSSEHGNAQPGYRCSRCGTIHRRSGTVFHSGP